MKIAKCSICKNQRRDIDLKNNPSMPDFSTMFCHKCNKRTKIIFEEEEVKYKETTNKL